MGITQNAAQLCIETARKWPMTMEDRRVYLEALKDVYGETSPTYQEAYLLGIQTGLSVLLMTTAAKEG